MPKIRIDQLSDEITRTLVAYTDEIEDGLEEAKARVSKKAVRTLRASSPKRKGDYAKGWRVTEQDGAMVIHNAKRGSLTHLLEHGHAKRGGGRVAGTVHISPVEEEAIRSFEQAVEKVVRR
jgi:hypothetical protein